MAEGLGIDPREVSSPTFTLIQHYDGGRLPLHHVDLYRLESIEVENLGLEELTSSGGVTAIEWPDRLPQPFDESVLVRIEHEDDETRTIRIAPASSARPDR
jgi:tRNA threonylcarbamoyladenosine biosynthesis protein TsaE